MYGLYQIVYFTIFDIWRTLISPFFIVVVCIVLFQYNRLNRSPISATMHSIIFGIFAGIIATVSFIYLEVVIIPKDFIYIYVITVILSFIDLRFMCFTYGGSIITLSNLIFNYPLIDGKQIMTVVAVLHIIESFLILINGHSQKEEGSFFVKGEFVGGFNMNRFWPVPFVIFIGDGLIYPISLVAILSYGDFSISTYPRRKVITTASQVFAFSSILLLLTRFQGNEFIPPIFALLGHEFIILINKYLENKRSSIFNIPLKGIRVLGVHPRSIGHEIGVRPGDIILGINQVQVKDEVDMIDVLSFNPKKIEIEFFSTRKGIIKKTYRGHKKTLGLVFVPRA